jgi:hypothetical protein
MNFAPPRETAQEQLVHLHAAAFQAAVLLCSRQRGPAPSELPRKHLPCLRRLDQDQTPSRLT